LDRRILTNALWAKMEPRCLGKPSDPGWSGNDNGQFHEVVLWIARTGSWWRDLPEHLGKWNTVFKRYSDWVKAFDCNWLNHELDERGAGIIISQRPKRVSPLPIDEVIYGWRHLIENFICKLIDFKRISLR
jgi:transposase